MRIELVITPFIAFPNSFPNHSLFFFLGNETPLLSRVSSEGRAREEKLTIEKRNARLDKNDNLDFIERS